MLRKDAFSEPLEVYDPMWLRRNGEQLPPIPTHRLMSLAALCLGGSLASVARLRLIPRMHPIMKRVNDVLALEM